MQTVFTCHKISPGIVEGEILVSKDPILFYKTNSLTGEVTEIGHSLEGRCIKDKILVFPGGKGSSVVQADGMYKLDRDGTAPKGFIVRDLDTVLVSSAIIMEMPMVDRAEDAFYKLVKDGDIVRMDAGRGILEILP